MVLGHFRMFQLVLGCFRSFLSLVSTHKINLNHGGLYIDLSWLNKKKKKTTINPINDGYKCCQYDATVTLNHEEIGKNFQGISKINKHNWKGITYLSGNEDWKFENSNPTICYILKNKYISSLHFKTQLKSWKQNHSFNDTKWKRMALSCSKKIICII